MNITNINLNNIASLAKYLIFLILVTKSLSARMPIQQKKCTDCKYYLQNQYVNDKIFGKCLYNPTKLHKIFNLITGELIEDRSDYHYCNDARQFDYLCGTSGKNYRINKLDKPDNPDISAN